MIASTKAIIARLTKKLPLKSAGAFLGQRLQNGDVGGLRALIALLDLELDLLAFIQIAETFRLDGGIMDEDIRAILARDKAVALATIEPLDRTDDSFRHMICLLMAKKEWFVRVVPSDDQNEMTRVKKPRVIVFLFPT
jgi:hypothetical protein